MDQDNNVPRARCSAGKDYKGVRRVLTYGTFDTLHYGHIRFLKRAAELGDYLIVALSTDELNASNGKTSFNPYEVRKAMLETVRCVNLVIPWQSWDQILNDVKSYSIDMVVMGDNWAGSERFECLKDYCKVVYLERTEGISDADVIQAMGSEVISDAETILRQQS